MVSCVLLAAGTSSRMKDDNKLLLSLSGKEILLHTLEALFNSKVDELILVVGYRSKEIEALVIKNNFDIKTVLNDNYSHGLTSSIKKGVEKTSPETTGIMICMADMPFLKSNDYNLIIDHFYQFHKENKQAIIVPFFNHRRGNPVIFSVTYKQLILKHQEPEGCRDLIDKYNHNVREINITTDFKLLDIDTREDFENAQKEQI